MWTGCIWIVNEGFSIKNIINPEVANARKETNNAVETNFRNMLNPQYTNVLSCVMIWIIKRDGTILLCPNIADEYEEIMNKV